MDGMASHLSAPKAVLTGLIVGARCDVGDESKRPHAARLPVIDRYLRLAVSILPHTARNAKFVAHEG